MITLKINDKQYNSLKQFTILQLCNNYNIDIPRFCYHEKLSIAGNCRMCLIEEIKSIKPIVACSVSIANNMQIYTNTIKVKKAREGVLEFLLINHPLDCPICDQGGECDLQDEALVFGGDFGRFYESKRAVENKDFGPLIKTIMNRCIHCTRCVRFSTEIAGIFNLGVLGRGSKMEIGFYISHLLDSEISGNVIDLCPVGALTSKPYAFSARSWELKSLYTIDIFDSLLSDIKVDIKGNDIFRILPRINPQSNEEWISNRIRFCYDALRIQRLLTPKVRIKNIFINISWLRAFKYIKIYFINILKFLYVNKLQYFNLDFYIGDTIDLKTLYIIKNFSNVLGFNKFYSFNFNKNSEFLNDIKDYKNFIFFNLNLRIKLPILNIKFRQQVMKKKVNCYMVGTYSNYTYFVKHIGISLKNMYNIIRGKHWLCYKLSLTFNKNLCLYSNNKLNFNNNYYLTFKNLPINVTNSNLLFKGTQISLLHTQNTHFIKNYLLYLVNFDLRSIKLFRNKNTGLIIYQGHHGDYGCYYSDIILPSVTFFELSGEFVDIYGSLKKTSKILQSYKQTRSDFKIVNSLLYFLTKKQNNKFIVLSISNQILKIENSFKIIKNLNIFLLKNWNNLNSFLNSSKNLKRVKKFDGLPPTCSGKL